MGTLFSQNPREHLDVGMVDLREFVENCVEIAEDVGVDVSKVIEAAKVLEMQRKTTAYINNGDAFDEQIGGLGEILKGIAESLDSMASSEI